MAQARKRETRMKRMTLTVVEAARALGIGRVTAYRAVREGRIPALKMGRRLVVPKPALEKMLAEAGNGKEVPHV